MTVLKFKFVPAIRFNLFAVFVMLRHETSASDETDASYLSMTVNMEGTVQAKRISTAVGFKNKATARNQGCRIKIRN